MRVVAEYRQHAKRYRDLAARASNPVDQKKLKYEAEAWAKMAALRERNLTDKTAAPLALRRAVSENATGLASKLPMV